MAETNSWLSGCRINILHTNARAGNASLAASRLSKLGAVVRLIEVISDGTTAEYRGKLFYFKQRPGRLEQAKQLADLLGGIEKLCPEFRHFEQASDVSFSVWVVRENLRKTDGSVRLIDEERPAPIAKPMKFPARRSDSPASSQAPAAGRKENANQLSTTNARTPQHQPFFDYVQCHHCSNLVREDRLSVHVQRVHRSSQLARAVPPDGSDRSAQGGVLRDCRCYGSNENCRYCSGTGVIESLSGALEHLRSRSSNSGAQSTSTSPQSAVNGPVQMNDALSDDAWRKWRETACRASVPDPTGARAPVADDYSKPECMKLAQ